MVGVGIGGTAERAMQMAKHSLTRECGAPSDDPMLAGMERELLERINRLGTGPQELGGRTTALAVHIEQMPTHIAGLPVTVNMQCRCAASIRRHLRREASMSKSIHAPLRREELRDLCAGDRVTLSGVIYTGRDAAHKRLCALVDEGKPLPFDLRNQVIYYAGSCPAKPGNPIGSCGPTTSYRMDAYASKLCDLGLIGMIGKGQRSEAVIEAIRRNGGVYFAATGGAGALITACVKSAEVIAFEDLGTEAIRRLEVEKLPLIVAIDAHGGNLYEEGPARYCC